jgi:ferredoxin-type protein NapF
VKQAPVDQNRRRFLFADVKGREAPLYPPWASERQEFERFCTQCNECMTACPENIIEISPTGFPVVDFSRGECTFCGRCVERCEANALSYKNAQIPWLYRAGVSSACLAMHNVMCDSCRDACPQTAIAMGPNIGKPPTPLVDDALCNGCGACVRVCPAGAIQIH